MRIAVVAYLHGSGGAERQITMLANALADRGHDVQMLVLAENNPKYPISEKVHIIDLSGDEGTGKLRSIKRFFAYRQAIRQLSPDVSIHFNFQSAYFSAALPKTEVGKVIYSERGDPGDAEYDGLMGAVRKLVLPHIDGFVFQSRGAQSYFDDEVQSRSIVIPNPVYVNRSDYPELTKRKKMIVSVGRLHKQKNQELLIEAFSRIAGSFPEYELLIFGEGELEAYLSQKIDVLGLQGRVRLMGTTRRLHEAIYDASLFVLSSDYEGLPNALLEAMALGLPCISTDCRPGGAREIICDGKDGLIVPIGDAEKLSEAMRSLLSNPEYAKQLAERAQESIARFRAGEVYGRWESFIEGCCNAEG